MSKTKISSKGDNNGVTFAGYLREDQKIFAKNNAIERLDTTMANQSHQLLRTSDNGCYGFENRNQELHSHFRSQERKLETETSA